MGNTTACLFIYLCKSAYKMYPVLAMCTNLYIVAGLHIHCASHQILSRSLNKDDDIERASRTHWGEDNWIKDVVRISEGKRALGRPPPRWESKNKTILEEIRCTGVDELNCLCVGTSGGLLWIRELNFGFGKRWRVRWLGDLPLASEGFRFMELATFINKRGIACYNLR
jgi:hypothetical protein